MHIAEKELAKACRKIAKWKRGNCLFQVLPTGFILKMAGDSEMVPTIGVVNEQLVGAQDDFDMFLDLIGYEGQVERVLFDPSRVKFILDAGWSGKYWMKPTPAQIKGADFVVDTIGTRFPQKVSALAIILIAAVHREGHRRLLHPFKSRK